MKRNIIILVALIVLCAMPVLAKPMVVVTNPSLDNGFMLPELNDEQLIKVEGEAIRLEFTEDPMKLGKFTINVNYVDLYVSSDGAVWIMATNYDLYKFDPFTGEMKLVKTGTGYVNIQNAVKNLQQSL